MGKKFDIAGWCTKSNIKCSDGRTIIDDAFKACDGKIVPLVWNHQHNGVDNVLGHALLENRKGGVYTYCFFNETENAKIAKMAVEHGDITAFSIYANQLKQQGGNVLHGVIKEVSLVLAGANPGAYIETVISHSDYNDEEAIISVVTEEPLDLAHGDEDSKNEEETMNENEDLKHSEDEKAEGKAEANEDAKDEAKEETVQDIYDSFTEKQKEVVHYLIGTAIEEAQKGKEENNGGKEEMKHNVFDNDTANEQNVLTHVDGESILAIAKTKSVGSLQDAIEIFAAENNKSLKHGIDDIESLFPDHKDVYPVQNEFIERDQSWVGNVMSKVHKSPISRIRTRQSDISGSDLRALGYKGKGEQKNYVGNIKLKGRTTDPQTVYRKDKLERDDIIDITDFNVVEYQYKVMKKNLNEELALAFLVGDGRDENDEGKIKEDHIRSIYHDDELYTIHADVDIEAARAELQGSNTSANFGENYIYAEAIIQSALYAREQYKGSGNLEFYCTPHLLNVMLLARDLNGRRIYESKNDLAAALNVSAIHTVEQFEGRTRVDVKNGNVTKKLLGLFVNLSDYQVGSTKGGEITKFEQFDIDFNQYKYLIETRLSGALTRVKSAIALEEPVVIESGGSESTDPEEGTETTE